MASAFESSLRKWNSKTTSHRETKEDSDKKPPPRRSRSVSAFSRAAKSDVSSEFSTTRDNPLFWGAGNSMETPPNTERGRSVSRNSRAGNANPLRGRSVSRGPIYRVSEVFSNSPFKDVEFCGSGCGQSEVDEECKPPARHRNRSGLHTASSDRKKANSPRIDFSSSDRGRRSRSSQLQQESSAASANSLSCSRNQPMEKGHLPISSFEPHALNSFASRAFQEVQIDDLTTGNAAPNGIYEAVQSEVRRAISDIHYDLETAFQRSGATAFANTDVTDITPDLVSPGAVELVLGIRSEYTKKLEQSQERARKLRADLAIEEYRALELSRILNEVIPDTKVYSVRKLHPGRKLQSTIDRKKISRNLTEDALSYFDECVSLSTFDGSDFSQDDLPLPSQSNSLVNGGQNCSSAGRQDSFCLSMSGDGDVTEGKASVGLKCEPTTSNLKSEFSFSSKQAGQGELLLDASYYARSFEKESCGKELKKSAGSWGFPNWCDEGSGVAAAESLLFDHLVMKNRIDSGSLHLCSGASIRGVL